jgi:hypothetical protein
VATTNSKNINQALVDIQSRLKAPKNQYNGFGRYKYRSAEDILEAVKPLLKENGCSLTINDEIIPIGNRIYVKSTAELNNGTEKVSTTAFAREEDQKKGMDASQVTGAASSYARKYALNGLFCIDDTKDADTLNNSAEYTKPTAQKQAAAQAQPNTQSLLLAAKGESAKITDRNGFGAWWNKYPTLQQNQEFLAIAQELGKKFPKK